MRVRGKPFLAVDYPVVAAQFRFRLENFWVRATLRLGHRERGNDLIVEQRLQKPLLLIRRPIMRENLGVARVRRLASKHNRRESRAPQDLVHQRELDLPVTLPPELRPEMARPQFALAHLGLQRPHQLVAFRIAHIVRMPQHVVERLDFLAHELIDPVEVLLELGLGFKIPTHSCSSNCRAIRQTRDKDEKRASSDSPADSRQYSPLLPEQLICLRKFPVAPRRDWIDLGSLISYGLQL